MAYDGEAPTTKEEYWELVDNNWEDLSSIISVYHPSYNKKHKMPITAAFAENFREQVEEEIKSQDVNLSALERAELAKKDRHENIVAILNETWWGIPESTSCWSIKGFGLLCDLCSESYCLEEQLEDGIEGTN